MGYFHIYIVLQGPSGVLQILNHLKVTTLNGPKKGVRIFLKHLKTIHDQIIFVISENKCPQVHSVEQSFLSVAPWTQESMGSVSALGEQKPYVGFSHECTHTLC